MPACNNKPVYEDPEFRVYNSGTGYITVQYKTIVHTPVMQQYLDKQTKTDRYRCIGTKKEEVWKIFPFDCPRGSFEAALKVIVRQRMKRGQS